MTQTATAPAAPTTASNVVMTHRQILLVIYGLMAGMFLGALDQTIVGTAIRTIGDDLHGLDQQAWVTTGYLIASTVTTPIYGKLSDIFGRRPLFITAIGIFIVGSFAASFSDSMLMLAGFRALQGLGAGGLMSLPLAIMGDMLAPRERAKYQGYFLAVFGISSVIGPLVGGVFAGADQLLFIAGWRWVFLINVPIGVIALFMVLTFLHLPKFGNRGKPRIDWWGATLVIVTLVPLLLIAEQGREWGWDSPAAFACYAIGALGLIAFIIVERAMGDDAILPMKLFGSRVFSMSAILSVLVGFGMFGAMLTIPLYLQIVKGVTPTESGFAMLPMVLGLMISSIASGQIISKTGNYQVFPVTGTAFTAVGFTVLTFLTADRPLWFLMLGMFLIGLGLGQLMQTLTLAAQNSVSPRDIGVATSAATFFRQIGGTMGTAVLLSVLFTLMPTNISAAMQNESDLKSALNAAMTPSVANASKNQGVMDEIWTKIVDPVQQNVQDGLDQGAAQAKQAADAAVTKQVTAAEQQALETAATKANASVVDGKLQIDYSDRAQRENVVDQVAPTLVKQLKSGDSAANSSTDSATSDTSFLNGADPRLSRPFLVGFSDSAVRVYYVGLAVILLAFVLTWFFRVPPLRKTSALQEQADAARTADAAAAAPGAGPEPMVPGASSRDVPTSPDVTPQPRSARAPGAPDGADDTRAPLPDATTHGAHSAAAPVDEPPTTTGAIRTRAAHAATAVEPGAPEAAADAAEASRASRPDTDDVHAHGRHSAE
ncbi:MDR family MFS transporter [Curtobacterium poinsettiae]|uniref:DHA2 family efflux MFS transporter permease subunit n=1 Tax=Curtobacterium poinsettiae TaxID=159612 RepID=A0ABT3S6Y7_9MICO|nr:MDR family MFS transporter [Curtobacterium flaccumfaciens]MBT1610024.1 DHA2 family efflux MFS transporter permease subunit [Curtobacterium flaccumfaciens pv. poinsettiae]MCX2850024.1 DHA2 family efflux MFS transporter permease subunit [Curtobacterium flaccumfaciens pv. poinsettiae]UXN19626.1 DHA2 family efflux MFS transporter permease subunit [Curtobacterium flaccumfaciens pv. poinsettiae]